MFRTYLLSIIRCLNTAFIRICIFHDSYIDCLLADSEHNCCEYSIKTPDDGHSVSPKHVELFTKIKLRNSASFLFLLQEYIVMHGPLNVKINK